MTPWSGIKQALEQAVISPRNERTASRTACFTGFISIRSQTPAPDPRDKQGKQAERAPKDKTNQAPQAAKFRVCECVSECSMAPEGDDDYGYNPAIVPSIWVRGERS